MEKLALFILSKLFVFYRSAKAGKIIFGFFFPSIATLKLLPAVFANKFLFYINRENH